MDPVRVLLLAAILLLNTALPATCVRLCGFHLAEALRNICDTRGYYTHTQIPTQLGVSPLISRQAASSFLGSSSTPRHRRQRRRARTGRIVTECCDNDCDRTILESYCMPQPEEETSPNDVFESDSVETNLERPSSNSNTPDATRSTGVEAPQPRTNITATSPPDVQPEKENTLSEVEVINCPPIGKKGRKSKSTESSSKKTRTSTGLSREELKHCKTLVRKASRELKKQQSREKRRRAKEQRRQDKTKKKRLESAERSRGTDRVGLNGDAAMEETVPRANDVRKPKSRPPKSSREQRAQTSTARHTLDDPTQPRRPGRKPHPRGSSRERKAHLAAAEAEEAARAAAAQEETQTPSQTRRQRRNILQQITQSFL